MGHNWARWLLVAWLAFHVVVSGFHSMSEMAAHAVLLIVVGDSRLRLRPPHISGDPQSNKRSRKLKKYVDFSPHFTLRAAKPRLAPQFPG